jgi:hypothetical protein
MDRSNPVVLSPAAGLPASDSPALEGVNTQNLHPPELIGERKSGVASCAQRKTPAGAGIAGADESLCFFVSADVSLLE